MSYEREEPEMMMRCFRAKGKQGGIGAVLILGLIFLGANIAAGNGDSEKGKTIFQESCQHCHGFTGKGDGEMAEYLDPRPSNLASQATQAKADRELKDTILKGKEGTAMAGFEGALEEPQLIDLLAYLRSLKP